MPGEAIITVDYGFKWMRDSLTSKKLTTAYWSEVRVR